MNKYSTFWNTELTCFLVLYDGIKFYFRTWHHHLSFNNSLHLLKKLARWQSVLRCDVTSKELRISRSIWFHKWTFSYGHLLWQKIKNITSTTWRCSTSAIFTLQKYDCYTTLREYSTASKELDDALHKTEFFPAPLPSHS